MSFETTLASVGKLFDKVIDWHMSLSWPLLLLLCGLYFICISIWFLKLIPLCCDGPQ